MRPPGTILLPAQQQVGLAPGTLSRQGTGAGSVVCWVGLSCERKVLTEIDARDRVRVVIFAYDTGLVRPA
ncbi:hypothetical protein ABZ471_45640 [Streptomyces sp. NPDC005728]|uniref:hypothetical protein n=1 Tax=Streptomyces sp. NPDC005728 TaxID=3157054 RepID=UPI0033E6DD65